MYGVVGTMWNTPLAVLESGHLDGTAGMNPARMAYWHLQTVTGDRQFGGVLFLDGRQIGSRSRLTGVIAYNKGAGWSHLLDVGASGSEIEALVVRAPLVMIRDYGPPIDNSEEQRVHALIGKCPPKIESVVGVLGDRQVAKCHIGGREYFIVLYVGGDEPELRFDLSRVVAEGRWARS